jgi:hypothetical protein
VAVYRNREQNLDEQRAGTPPTAAGFADFFFTLNVTKKF